MYTMPTRILQIVAATALATAIYAGAQTPAPDAAQAPATPSAAAPATPAAAPAPLSTFVLTGPLQWLPPATFSFHLFGSVRVYVYIFVRNPVRTTWLVSPLNAFFIRQKVIIAIIYVN